MYYKVNLSKLENINDYRNYKYKTVRIFAHSKKEARETAKRVNNSWTVGKVRREKMKY